MRCRLLPLGGLSLLVTVIARAAVPSVPATGHYDVCVYGGTSAGVIAAIQVRKMGRSVILVSPDKHLGGMTSGGLGFTDMGDERTVGGLSRDYFHRIWVYYQNPPAWPFEAREAFRNAGQHGPGLNADLEIATVFEPHVAERTFADLISENAVEVVPGRLDRKNGVRMAGSKITSMQTEDGRVFSADAFIDATYEGDLMAGAKVRYTVGREANSQYRETADGIQPGQRGNQLPDGIDPFRIKGDLASGLLPRVNPTPGGVPGSADCKIQAYCYRMCLTDLPANRLPIEKPAGYDAADYEILFRAIEAGQAGGFCKFSGLPNRKTDSNNESGISTDFIGMNYEYPEADYTTRERIAHAHELWQRGLLWTLQNHPRIPASIRKSYGRWGLPKDEFIDSGHWPSQLYVREARRMVNDHVIDEAAILHRTAPQPIGLGSYTMDSHNVQYHVNAQGFIAAEGNVQKATKGPYQIDLGAIVPKRGECDNLLVPVCLAASHIAYGSIRMESVFMILGQSAGTGAALACEDHRAMQDLDYARLKARLEADGQILALPSK
jgi:hypothetical protein